MTLLADIVARFPNTSTVGRLIRVPLSLLPRNRALPILTGPGRGLRWMPLSGPRGMWVGTFEPDLAEALVASLSPGRIFFDVGANVGYYTVIGRRLVGTTGRTVAVEPHPEAVRRLTRNIDLNGFADVVVVEAAACESEGTRQFVDDNGLTQGAVSPRGARTVTATRLDTLAETYGNPDVIKIDVEGGGAEVLRGASAILARRRTAIFLAVHISTPEAGPCREILSRHGYRITPFASDPDLWRCSPPA